MDTLIIYSPTITSRLKYVLKIVFHEIYQIDYQLTHQRENYLSSEATKINYSANQIINDDILRFNLDLDPKKAIEEINDIIKLVKKENGTLITTWHNDTFSNFGVWKGWKGVYEDMIKLMTS